MLIETHAPSQTDIAHWPNDWGPPFIIVIKMSDRCYCCVKEPTSKLLWRCRSHRPLVAGGIAELVAVGGGEVVQDGRTSRAYKIRVSIRRVTLSEKAKSALTVWVFHRHNLLVVVQIVQQRCEDPPRSV